MKTIKMNGSGNRPDIGHWEAGEIKTMPANVADILVGCKAGKEVKPSGEDLKPKDKPAPRAEKQKEEVKADA